MPFIDQPLKSRTERRSFYRKARDQATKRAGEAQKRLTLERRVSCFKEKASQSWAHVPTEKPPSFAVDSESFLVILGGSGCEQK
jgi:hypothetical protein